MKELSLYLLDIFYNSLASGANLIRMAVSADEQTDRLTIKITDNGKGMDQAFLKRVKDPYTTTRTERNVGMGIPLLTQAAEQTGGNVVIRSKIGCGTMLKAEFRLSDIDTPPMGDLKESLIAMIASLESCDLVFALKNERETRVEVDTREIRNVLGEEIPLSTPEVMKWIREYLDSEFENSIGE